MVRGDLQAEISDVRSDDEGTTPRRNGAVIRMQTLQQVSRIGTHASQAALISTNEQRKNSSPRCSTSARTGSNVVAIESPPYVPKLWLTR